MTETTAEKSQREQVAAKERAHLKAVEAGRKEDRNRAKEAKARRQAWLDGKTEGDKEQKEISNAEK